MDKEVSVPLRVLVDLTWYLEPEKRNIHVPLTPKKNFNYECIRDRLGSPPGPRTNARPLVPRRHGTSHKSRNSFVRLACMLFRPVLWNFTVQILTDSSSAIHCMWKQEDPADCSSSGNYWILDTMLPTWDNPDGSSSSRSQQWLGWLI